ncbi:alpha/beta hydrolase [Agromyces atrinae]|uniref:Putative membrane protein n=1 Tax=Agromyces atrinae TaxID=592376 RepID=A0A4Q2MD75_9MICO|nr:alpha/beta-hydrolase family protein [Agromyces atrinae]NYD67103.1 putative membrane protein [Agromyces atrinae]RXZ87050.1 hypothetical protein ESP50_08340 [Agromyces atrinae]
MTKRWWRADAGGVVVGLLGVIGSLTPSLLPRPALLQGVVAGLAFAVGYLVGAALFAVVRRLVPWRPPTRLVRGAWIALGALVIIGVILLAPIALGWQNEVRGLVEMPELTAADPALFVLGAAPVAVLCVLLGRGVLALQRRFARTVGFGVGLLGTTIVVGLGGFLAGAVVMGVLDGVYATRNGPPAPWIAEPDSEYRSAGDSSAMDWADLGRHGTAFVGGGPTAAEIETLTGQPALTPIRVYAGLGSADSIAERARLAVDELVRTGAFERDVLVVATATGSGWLEPQTVDAIEYVHGGDTAIVSMQYAYTPSWVSFVFDPDAPVEAARVLFDAVEEEWLGLPADDRPELISYGLSLGAHGSQAVFGDLADVRSRTDGALFVGSPNGSELWRELTAARDAGSPVWQPVVDSGEAVRWLSQAGDAGALPGPWREPRVAYLQHATDPVTWLGTELLWSEPEWLREPRADDVSPAMRWMPVVTGVQVTIDMLMGESVPARHGHNYGDVVVDGWVAVTGDGGLDAEALDRVRREIESYAVVQPASSVN